MTELLMFGATVFIATIVIIFVLALALSLKWL